MTATLDNLTYGEPLVITREVLLPVQFTPVRPAGDRAGRRTPGADPSARRRPVPATGWPTTCRRPTVTEGGSTAAAAAEVADPQSRFDAADLRPGRRRDVPAEPARRRDRRQPRRGHPVRAGRPGPARSAAADRGRQDDAWCCSCARTTPARCWRCSSSSPAAGSTCAGSSPGRPRRRSATTASPSTPRATSTTPGWPRRMMGLHRICADVVFLGSYPRADRAAPTIRRRHLERRLRRGRRLAAPPARLSPQRASAPLGLGARAAERPASRGLSRRASAAPASGAPGGSGRRAAPRRPSCCIRPTVSPSSW